MKKMKKIILATALSLVVVICANAQVEKLAGPRVGVTYISAGSTADFLRQGFKDDGEGIYGSTGSAFTTQYGWQWETRFADGGGNVVGIVEWIALVAGMEQGKFLPSLTSVIGIRTASGFEIGVGPNLSLAGVGMILGFGKNFKSGDLNIPVNLVFSPGRQLRSSSSYDAFNNPIQEYEYNSGARISLMFGFNLGT